MFARVPGTLAREADVAEPPQLPLISHSQQAVMASDVLDDQLSDLDVGGMGRVVDVEKSSVAVELMCWTTSSLTLMLVVWDGRV
jgi:hypothetical protein